MDTPIHTVILPQNGPNKSFKFLDLPPELRTQVYRHVLVAEVQPLATLDISDIIDLRRKDLSHQFLSTDDWIQMYRPKFPVALSRTCSQIHNEAASVLYGENTFLVHSTGFLSTMRARAHWIIEPDRQYLTLYRPLVRQIEVIGINHRGARRLDAFSTENLTGLRKLTYVIGVEHSWFDMPHHSGTCGPLHQYLERLRTLDFQVGKVQWDLHLMQYENDPRLPTRVSLKLKRFIERCLGHEIVEGESQYWKYWKFIRESNTTEKVLDYLLETSLLARESISTEGIEWKLILEESREMRLAWHEAF